MKKLLGALKEKFGKFEIFKEQLKKLKGGEPLCLASVEVPSPGEDPCGGGGGTGAGGTVLVILVNNGVAIYGQIRVEMQFV